jgi:DNA-binding GntR family transcriptional regulator
VVAAEHLLRGCRRDRSKEAHGEHEQILEAVQDRDPEAAERVRSRFTNSLKSMLLSAAIP